MLTEEMVIGMDEMCVTLLDFLNAWIWSLGQWAAYSSAVYKNSVIKLFVISCWMSCYAVVQFQFYKNTVG